MSIPSEGETFAKLLEYIRKAQESAAMLSHLSKDKSTAQSQGWLVVSEQLKAFVRTVTALATKRLQ